MKLALHKALIYGNDDDPFQKNGSFLFLSDSYFKIGQAFILNVSLGIHL